VGSRKSDQSDCNGEKRGNARRDPSPVSLKAGSLEKPDPPGKKQVALRLGKGGAAGGGKSGNRKKEVVRWSGLSE